MRVAGDVRDAKVGEFDSAVGGDEDVAGFDVAVFDAAGVSSGQGVGEMDANADDLVEGQPGLGEQQFAEASSWQVIHDQPDGGIIGLNIVDSDDVGVAAELGG